MKEFTLIKGALPGPTSVIIAEAVKENA
jgi:hypothetical protein